MNDLIRTEIKELRNISKTAFVASVNEAAFPQVKCMFVLEHDSLETQYFSTNTSSHRAKQFMKNPNASVYYCNTDAFQGALFTGTMEICTDHETKQFLWRDGFEIYYPKGVDDDDYCVLKFTADTVNYYHDLINETISIKEL